MTTSPIFLYEFGPYRLDLREARLQLGEEALPLPPKSFEVLALLVRRAGTLVAKEALMRELWPDTFIEEANLARHVWAVRKVLRDDDGTYIETVPKRGYRFVAGVTAVAAPGDPGGRAATRLMILPFRWLKPEPELDFLAFSLPDAIGSSLSAVDGIAVRSSLMAERLTGPALDFARIAREGDVTAVVTGTLLRDGERLRVQTQLVSVPSGTVLSTASSEAPVHDLFLLQDALAGRLVECLAGPLISGEMTRDVPASGHAYESYLRANRLAQAPATFDGALELYESCVAADARFAPAWARLGRLHRVMAKYTGQYRRRLPLAEDALHRALRLNPRLSLAHSQLAYLEVDLGRAQDAMVRLLDRAHQQRHEAELFAGLVHACRYNGLLDASVAAHHRALALDPLVATSVVQTYWMRGDVDIALTASATLAGGSLRALLLALVGREEEAVALLRTNEARTPQFLIRQFSVSLRALLEGDRSGCLSAITHIEQADYADPEGLLLLARYLSRLGEDTRALQMIQSAVDQGFAAASFMRGDPWLAPLRSHASFAAALADAAQRRAEAAAAYARAGGPELLGA